MIAKEAVNIPAAIKPWHRFINANDDFFEELRHSLAALRINEVVLERLTI